MKTNWNLSGQVEVKIKLMWLHKSAHPLTNTLLKHLLILLQLLVVWGMSLSAWHSSAWKYLPTLLYKNVPNLSDCEGISCAQPSSDHPTDF